MSLAVLALVSNNVTAISLNTNKEVVEYDVNEDPGIRADRLKAEAAAKEAEWKRKFNPFDGQVHEDDGTTWNLGDKVPVKGVNLFSQRDYESENRIDKKAAKNAKK